MWCTCKSAARRLRICPQQDDSRSIGGAVSNIAAYSDGCAAQPLCTPPESPSALVLSSNQVHQGFTLLHGFMLPSMQPGCRTCSFQPPPRAACPLHS